MKNTAITAYLMDLGNVLIKITPSALEKYFIQQGVDITRQTKTDFYKLAEDYECGKYTSEQFLQEASRLTGITNHDTLIHAWNLIIPPHQEISLTIDACRAAKEKGIKLILFSNTNELHIQHTRRTYPGLLELFDHLILSYEIGGAKPFPPMYQYAITQLNLNPSQTLYFDDKPENIQAALPFGFLAHLFDYNRPESFSKHIHPSIAF